MSETLGSAGGAEGTAAVPRGARRISGRLVAVVMAVTIVLVGAWVGVEQWRANRAEQGGSAADGRPIAVPGSGPNVAPSAVPGTVPSAMPK